MHPRVAGFGREFLGSKRRVGLLARDLFRGRFSLFGRSTGTLPGWSGRPRYVSVPYLDSSGRDDRLSGGSRRIPIDTKPDPAFRYAKPSSCARYHQIAHRDELQRRAGAIPVHTRDGWQAGLAEPVVKPLGATDKLVLRKRRLAWRFPTRSPPAEKARPDPLISRQPTAASCSMSSRAHKI